MPGSWEIHKIREERVLLGIIYSSDADVSINYAQHMRTLQLPPDSDFIRVGGLPYGPARNQAAKMALEKGYNLAFLDSDVRVEPDAFMRLMETKLMIVSGLYYQRFNPYQPVIFNEGKDEKGTVVRIPVAGWNPGDIVPCTFVPSGLTIYRLGLLKDMFANFPLPFMWGVDIAPVPDTNGMQAPPMSEDFTFSWRAKQLGYQPFIHTGIVGLHETRAVIGPKWMIAAPSPDPINGMIGIIQ